MRKLIFLSMLLISFASFSQDITFKVSESVKVETGVLEYSVNPEKTKIFETHYDCQGEVQSERVFEVVESCTRDYLLHAIVEDINCCDELFEIEFDRMNDEVFVTSNNTLKRIYGDAVHVKVYTL